MSQQPNGYPPRPNQQGPQGYYQQPQITTVIQKNGPSFLVRAFYFVLIGWWFGGFVSAFGYFLCLTVIGLPIGLMVLNRLPTFLTLRPITTHVTTTMGYNGTTVIINRVPQRSFLVRVLYFVFIGWWFSGFWLLAAYGLCLLVLGIPFAIMMYDRLPAVLTLRRH